MNRFCNASAGYCPCEKSFLFLSFSGFARQLMSSHVFLHLAVSGLLPTPAQPAPGVPVKPLSTLQLVVMLRPLRQGVHVLQTCALPVPGGHWWGLIWSALSQPTPPKRSLI